MARLINITVKGAAYVDTLNDLIKPIWPALFVCIWATLAESITDGIAATGSSRMCAP